MGENLSLNIAPTTTSVAIWRLQSGVGSTVSPARAVTSISLEVGQETFHLVESKASFSLRLGCGLGTGCAELGRLFFGVELLMSAFIDRAIRFDFASALSTLTVTICPALTASEGSLMNRFESSLMCTRPS